MLLGPDEVDLFEGSRARLEAIAYRLLGSASDAEDAVQDTFLRWQAADREQVRSPEAWLTRVLTNLCLNHLTSARARRETYVGQWLPEPVLTGDPMLGPADTAEQRESVSMAVLVLMERLSPQERAVYVLREAFGYAHAEIAEIVNLTEPNCQQIYRRAKQHLSDGRSRTEVDRASAHRIAAEFLAATAGGEIEPLVGLLTADVTGIADGGGVVPARRTPIGGALAVARYLRGLLRPSEHKRGWVGGVASLYDGVVNGDPAILAQVGERVAGVLVLEATPAGITAVRIHANPGKLDRISRAWAAAEHDEPLLEAW
ncbi:RNA polymerase sigma factor SigJ [Nocardia miyunensis]|uniref:RNA polymerase sigma factor SigJ n=1 Tax=Nocardia miyunensis TaxID=282684 RepID=UPI0008352102|nr:RNA polymerase sigma factor SigJ [Nocardia miyunensis]